VARVTSLATTPSGHEFSFYGGKQIDLLSGIDIAGSRFGLNVATITIEARGAVLQNLYGPQLGQAWQVDISFVIGF
jgi:hypothetical protein